VSSKIFQITATIFLGLLQNKAHMICVPICKKTVEQVFKISFQYVWEFFQF